MWRPRQQALGNGPGALMRRAQQWFAARERLLSTWIARAHVRARASVQARRRVRMRVPKLGGAGAIMLPFWWEYESPIKRRLALEATLRRMFALVPERHMSP